MQKINKGSARQTFVIRSSTLNADQIRQALAEAERSDALRAAGPQARLVERLLTNRLLSEIFIFNVFVIAPYGFIVVAGLWLSSLRPFVVIRNRSILFLHFGERQTANVLQLLDEFFNWLWITADNTVIYCRLTLDFAREVLAKELVLRGNQRAGPPTIFSYRPKSNITLLWSPNRPWLPRLARGDTLPA